MPKGSALSKEMKCSDELQALVKAKKISRGDMMKQVWKYIKKHDLKGVDGGDGRIIKLDDKLEAVVTKSSALKKAIKEKRKVTMRGNTIKIPKGCIFMTELAGGLSKNLS
jgi:chromatin remodeling complex protein RSC6